MVSPGELSAPHCVVSVSLALCTLLLGASSFFRPFEQTNVAQLYVCLFILYSYSCTPHPLKPGGFFVDLGKACADETAFCSRNISDAVTQATRLYFTLKMTSLFTGLPVAGLQFHPAAGVCGASEWTFLWNTNNSPGSKIRPSSCS